MSMLCALLPIESAMRTANVRSGSADKQLPHCSEALLARSKGYEGFLSPLGAATMVILGHFLVRCLT
ncbi:hypothetical protein [Roseovarius sp. 2305UL8-3]|uniref:hypothetical protein n=1 Tax=Roseovarius conchicola TaxID=3121636 RepID=UPI003529243B